MTLRPLPLAIAVMAALVTVKLVVLADRAGWSAAPEAHASAPSAPPSPPAKPEAVGTRCKGDISAAEAKILQDLRARRRQLDAREHKIGVEESVLAAAEKKVASRVKELAALQAKLQVLDAARKKRAEANWQGLVRTYEAMKPRDAAKIMDGMDMPVLLQVLDRMSDRKAAMVLAAMQPDRARAATTQLADMRLKATQTPATGQ